MISIPGTHDGHLCHVEGKCRRQFEADFSSVQQQTQKSITLQNSDRTVFIFEQSLNAFVSDL